MRKAIVTIADGMKVSLEYTLDASGQVRRRFECRPGAHHFVQGAHEIVPGWKRPLTG